MRVDSKIEVAAPLQTVYNQWTQFEDFPQFMEGVQQVEQIADDRLRWKAEVAGKAKEWTARITRQVPDEVIAWQSEEGAGNAGEVIFRRVGDDQTEVELHMEYEPEDFTERVGDALGIPARRVEGDLERFKEFIEGRGRETGAWRGEIGNERGTAAGTASSEDRYEDATDRRPPNEAFRAGATANAPDNLGMTERQDAGGEGMTNADRGGRGSMAYGGRGDVGSGGPGGLGGEGRSSEGGALRSGGGSTGGLGGQGRGQEGSSSSSGVASSVGEYSTTRPDASNNPPRGEAPPAGSEKTESADVSYAGGAGGLGEEDRIADMGLRSPGGMGRESMSSEGLPQDEEDDSGPAGDDRPATRA